MLDDATLQEMLHRPVTEAAAKKPPTDIGYRLYQCSVCFGYRTYMVTTEHNRFSCSCGGQMTLIDIRSSTDAIASVFGVPKDLIIGSGS